jgi:ADP-ribose pyrophosphatase YjhB (NUDIX family)
MTPPGDRSPCKAHRSTLTAYRLTMAMSDYVWRLRELIGKQLLLMPSVSVLVQDDDDRLLLVRHADSGLWGLVGGAVEVDERPDEAAVRETQEETGLLVELTRLVTALGGPGFRVRYPNGDQTAYVTIVYEARPVGGVERADGDEVLELGWFRRDDLLAIDLGAIALATLRELGWLLA